MFDQNDTKKIYVHLENGRKVEDSKEVVFVTTAGGAVQVTVPAGASNDNIVELAELAIEERS